MLLNTIMSNEDLHRLLGSKPSEEASINWIYPLLSWSVEKEFVDGIFRYASGEKLKLSVSPLDTDCRFAKKIRGDDCLRMNLASYSGVMAAKDNVNILFDCKFLQRSAEEINNMLKERNPLILATVAQDQQAVLAKLSVLEKVNELWAFDQEQRNLFIAAGLNPSKVQVMPVAYNSQFYNPKNKILNKTNKCIFVADLSLSNIEGWAELFLSYVQTFTRADNVALVVIIHHESNEVPALNKKPTAYDIFHERLKHVVGFANDQSNYPEFFVVDAIAEAALLPQYLRGASAYIAMPSNWPYQLIKAVQLEVPVITCHDAKRWPFLNEQSCYQLTCCHNPQTNFETKVADLSAAMRRHASDPLRGQNLAQRASIEFEQNTSWEKTLEFVNIRTQLWYQKLKPTGLSLTDYVSKNKLVYADDYNQSFRIGIDARALTFEGASCRGIGTYIYQQLLAVIKKTPEWDYVLCLDGPTKSDKIDALLDLPNTSVRYYSEIGTEQFDHFYLTDVMSFVPGFDNPFRVCPHLPSSILFFDLTPIVLRDLHYDCWREMWRNACDLRLKQLKASNYKILAISECTKRDLIRCLNIDSNRISVISAGVNQSFRPTDYSPGNVEHVLHKHQITGPFFLSVGALDAHKNFETTVAAILSINQQLASGQSGNNAINSVQMVIVGDIAEDVNKTLYREQLEKRGYNHFIFTDYLPREELDCLYQAASALIFPSLYEGFGLPVLEAMANGCPVITSRNSSLPEVGGDAVLYLNEPKSSAEMVGLMQRVLFEQGLREKMITKGRERAANFSWEATADKTISVWKNEMIKETALN